MLIWRAKGRPGDGFPSLMCSYGGLRVDQGMGFRV